MKHGEDQRSERGGWSIAEARKRFSGLVDASVREPQAIYRRDHLVAVMVDPKLFEQFVRWKEEQVGRTLASAFDELRAICAEEGYVLPVEKRRTRPNRFAQGRSR